MKLKPFYLVYAFSAACGMTFESVWLGLGCALFVAFVAVMLGFEP